MVDDNTEVEVDVHVRPLLGHWKPISSQRKAATDYKEHLTSNGGLDSSVWKLSKKTDDGLSVSVSQSFKYILEDKGETKDEGKKEQKEEKKNEANLQCHWEAKSCSAKSTDRSSSTTYENPDFSFSETTGSTASVKTNCKKGKVSAKKSDNKMNSVKKNSGNLKPKKSISKTRGRSPQKKQMIMAENRGKSKSPAKKKRSAEKKSVEESKKGTTKAVKKEETPSVQRSDRKIVGDSKLSEEVSVVVPEGRFGMFNISELKCWLLLAIFVAFVIVYRNQLVAECAEEC